MPKQQSSFLIYYAASSSNSDNLKVVKVFLASTLGRNVAKTVRDASYIH